VRDGPVVERDRGKARYPTPPARGRGALPADSEPHREEMGVAVEAHVDALDRVPELRERRVEIEVDARRDRAEDSLVLQDPRRVEYDIGAARERADVGKGR